MYKTGFCGIGHCEGTAPVSPSGKPMKVCTLLDVCQCSCHTKFNKMYEAAGAERRLHQNPNYIPAVYPDLSEYLQPTEELDGAPLSGVTTTTVVRERPSEIAPGLVELAPTYTATPTGQRRRGQLEAEVQRVCHQGMMGEFDEFLTPQFIAQQIDPDNPPSTGAIGAVFNRWERIGYAKIHRKPLYFQHLTVEGMRDGLEACRRRAKGK
ncbi:hypothetical protein PBI_WOES_65 [Gordonia phage Woes]|uniref:Uncharacterized protein n=5 Tax=Woesvirus woes TaxID=1982751 RepID=A0A482JD73_9CAUD|nr:hypothetical protein BH793_gp48 [Gordonia phage Woes]QAX95334.1 hypothetical protein SEA_HELLO_65 [Gordonia phage Hello]QBP30342.1 hypothetical protein SEA_JORMUNGANDR_65 [Gordonia phage Jormungandr]QBP30637.1 hypothetical protein SEA_LAHIRIUM_65 [Gordonia phage Lahirium]QBP31840.1 hypothetical protein SEA_NIMI13_65 [Gordonia phage Nimi13]ANA85836.1 hypothetical protein PBI_WOES_65 [Gordonia phage Woes]